MLHLQENVNLTFLNTLHLKSTASHYVALTQLDQLESINSIVNNFSNFFILGGGSNVILPLQFQGLVIHNQLRGIKITKTGEECLVTAMAGENWDEFVAYCLLHHAFGLENLSFIPGTVGASPIQNIGAYGVEVKDFIAEVLVYDLQTAQRLILSNEECQFSYRNSILKNNPRYLVLSVSFRLSAQAKLNLSYGDVAQKMTALTNPSPADLRTIIIAIRQSKLPDPNELGNAGSFFHNPILPTKEVQKLKEKYPQIPIFPTPTSDYYKVSAGWLIDNLGLKGLRQGRIGIYPRQALVLVNYGDACQTELLQFAERIRTQVKDHYGIQLNIEPIILRNR